jgi:membrane protease subunit (stomatin/prohibitin family)
MAVIASVIKYEGDNDTFVWKHPCEDFNTTTQLIVHESQQALFFMNGQALDLFEAGRHTLHTQNIPLINKFFNRAYDDTSPFHCEVYFINKTEQMAVKWGTDSKVEYVEPTYGFPIQIGANGEMTLRVEDARRLLIKIVGTENELTQSGLLQKLRAFLMTKIKPYFANYIKQNAINIFEIDQKLSDMSEAMQKLLVPDFLDYGISLVNFFILEIAKPENDPSYKKFKEIHFRQYADIAEAKIRQSVGIIEEETEKQRMIIESQGLATKRQIEGYTYAQERGFDVAEGFAKNEGSGGNMANLGIGLGIMGSVGNAVGGVVNQAIGSAAQSPLAKCPNCGTLMPQNAKFCLECGSKLEASDAKEVECPKCGNKTPAGKFCIECGEKLGGADNE